MTYKMVEMIHDLFDDLLFEHEGRNQASWRFHRLAWQMWVQIFKKSFFIFFPINRLELNKYRKPKNENLFSSFIERKEKRWKHFNISLRLVLNRLKQNFTFFDPFLFLQTVLLQSVVISNQSNNKEVKCRKIF